MKRAGFFILALLIVAAGLSGCGKTKDEDIDMEALAVDILAADVFKDIISQIDSENSSSFAVSLFGIGSDGFEDCVLYVSTQVTPEEIALFKAVDKNQAELISKAVKDRVEMQKSSYQSYAPEEVPKLDNAIIKTSGLYVFYVCAENAAEAERIISGYLQ